LPATAPLAKATDLSRQSLLSARGNLRVESCEILGAHPTLDDPHW
jgi:hypothetical protein